MIRLHCISPSICFIMSLLMGGCTRSQSVADTKWSREVATSEGRSGFQRDHGRLEKQDDGNLVAFSRGEHEPCPGVGLESSFAEEPLGGLAGQQGDQEPSEVSCLFGCVSRSAASMSREGTIPSAQCWRGPSWLWVLFGDPQDEAGVVEGCGCAQPGAEEEEGRPNCCPQLSDGRVQRGQSLALLMTG